MHTVPGETSSFPVAESNLPAFNRRRSKRIALAILAVVWLLVMLWWLLSGFVPGMGSGKGVLSGDLSDGTGGGNGQAQAGSELKPGQTDSNNPVPPTASDANSTGSAGGGNATNQTPALVDSGPTPITLDPRIGQDTKQAAAGSSGVSGMFSGGRGSKFVFVLDKSSSMSHPGKFDAVIGELKR